MFLLLGETFDVLSVCVYLFPISVVNVREIYSGNEARDDLDREIFETVRHLSCINLAVFLRFFVKNGRNLIWRKWFLKNRPKMDSTNFYVKKSPNMSLKNKMAVNELVYIFFLNWPKIKSMKNLRKHFLKKLLTKFCVKNWSKFIWGNIWRKWTWLKF